MSAGLNPLSWLTWAAAAALVVITTRNPLYLTLAAMACCVVFLALDTRSQLRAAWRVVLRIALVVATISVLFNLLTVRAGDRVLFQIPHGIPIFGGAATLNALVYGLTSAIALLSLILIAATLSSAVDRASLLRLVPGPVAAVGVAGIIGLSFFPQTLRAIRDVHEAQAARGFRVRSPSDLRPLIVPVLHLGLERAVALAEAMESRGFGASELPRRVRGPWLPAGLSLLALGIALLGWGAMREGAFLALVGATLVAWVVRQAGGHARGRYRPLRWTRADGIVLATAGATVLLIALSLAQSPSPLDWSPYPRLEPPPFAALPGLASLLLLAPLLAPGTRPA